MERFLKRYQDRIVGSLSGFDRVVFQGSLLSIVYQAGMYIWLSSRGVLLKGFGAFAERLSAQIKAHGKKLAAEAKRPWIYLESSGKRKEEQARRIQQRDGIEEGLICVLSCVESCRSYRIDKNRESRRLELRLGWRKCLHLYFYYMDRDYGFMYVRVQTWLPFTIQIYMNGRECLSRQMDRAGIRYQRHDNCFSWIEDLAAAQRLADRFGERKWARLLSAFARRVNPLLDSRHRLSLRSYYWTIWQGEYATDVMFRDEAALEEIYPSLTLHALQGFHSNNVLQFLGRRTNSRFQGEVKTSWERRKEGVRVKHWVEENSIKMYDKHRIVLRIETTINNPRRFRVRRWATQKGQRVLAWVPMRKGIADLGRRVQVSRAANGRYLQALASVAFNIPAARVLDPVSRRVAVGSRCHRPLHPIAPDESRLFAAIQQGQFLIQGLRNRDIRRILFPNLPPDLHTRRHAAARISRLLALLCAHGLIYRVGKTHLYRIKKKGHEVMNAARHVRESTLGARAA